MMINKSVIEFWKKTAQKWHPFTLSETETASYILPDNIASSIQLGISMDIDDNDNDDDF